MVGNIQLLLPIVLPISVGAVFIFLNKFSKTAFLRICFILTNILTAIFTLTNVFSENKNLLILNITNNIPIQLSIDDVGVYFSLLTSLIWVITSIYSIRYFDHEQKENQFFGFFLMTYGVLIAIDYADNLITLYIFYELMTFITLALVVHSRTKESINAGIKYLIYSLFGAFLGLICILFINTYAGTTEFVAGGLFARITSDKSLLLVAAFLGIIGFCTKAGMFPLHGWLPSAHPVAPAPASAVLSGVITKAGVLAVIRLVYFIFGDDYIRGTWVQSLWVMLTLITVVMGSAMAYREKGLKKRLAFSTVSQVSYVLFGLALMTQDGFVGAMLHVGFHSVIKVALFLAAGAIIFNTGITQTENLSGIGKKLPLTMSAFTIASLALVGIPPLNGFVSKWYLAQGALNSNFDIISWLGPVLLLLSAILTAGYLLSISLEGFWPKKVGKAIKAQSESKIMSSTLLLLGALTIVTGIFSSYLYFFVANIAVTL